MEEQPPEENRKKQKQQWTEDEKSIKAEKEIENEMRWKGITKIIENRNWIHTAETRKARNNYIENKPKRKK